MFYLKTEVNGKTEEVEIYADEIYTYCFKCGIKIDVDMDDIISIYKNDGDLNSTSLAHGDCKKITNFEVIIGGKTNSPS